jgi:hypothetical protein
MPRRTSIRHHSSDADHSQRRTQELSFPSRCVKDSARVGSAVADVSVIGSELCCERCVPPSSEADFGVWSCSESPTTQRFARTERALRQSCCYWTFLHVSGVQPGTMPRNPTERGQRRAGRLPVRGRRGQRQRLTRLSRRHHPAEPPPALPRRGHALVRRRVGAVSLCRCPPTCCRSATPSTRTCSTSTNSTST